MICVMFNIVFDFYSFEFMVDFNWRVEELVVVWVLFIVFIIVGLMGNDFVDVEVLIWVGVVVFFNDGKGV